MCVVRENIPIVHRQIRRFRSIGGHRADDLFSVGLIALWKAIRTHEPERSSLKTWAGHIVYGAMLDHIRNETGTRRKIPPPVSIESVAEPGECQEWDTPEPGTSWLVAAVLGRMTKTDQIAVWESFATEQRNAADTLGISRSAVSHRKRAALQSAREQLVK